MFKVVFWILCGFCLFGSTGWASDPSQPRGFKSDPISAEPDRIPRTILFVPSQFASIQAAIRAADNGYTILVAPGMYQENINFLGKAVTVRSDGDGSPSTLDIEPESTVIDGGNQGSVVVFDHLEGNDSVLMGFTVTNGSGTLDGSDTYGGGIFCSEDASPMIIQNRIEGNIASRGSGIYLTGYYGYKQPVINYNLIRNNSASPSDRALGCGILMEDDSWPKSMNGTDEEDPIAYIEYNDISENDGWGIYCVFSDCYVWLTIRNNRVWNNRDGGISVYNDDSWLNDYVIVNNSVVGNHGHGISLRNYASWPGDGHVNENVIVGNQGVGFYLYGISEHIYNYVYKNKIAGNGSKGIHTEYVSQAWVDQNLIVGNYGSGIYAGVCSWYNIRNCVIAGNFGRYGGGLFVGYPARIHAVNNTIMKNRGDIRGGGVHNNKSELYLTNTIIWNNHSPDQPHIYSGSAAYTDVIFSDVKDGWPGTGNIALAPEFDPCPPLGNWTRDATYDAENHLITFHDDTAAWTMDEWKDKLINPDTTQRIHFIVTANTAHSITVWADWPTIDSGTPWVTAGSQYHMTGFHLTSLSPCRDAGTDDGAPDHDFDGDPRPQSTGWDIGADEFVE